MNSLTNRFTSPTQSGRAHGQVATAPLTLRRWRLTMATLVVAVAGTLSQTAFANPHEGHRGPVAHGAYGHGGPGMDMGMGMMGGGRHIGQMLKAVDATAEQRAQIKQIMEAARADMGPQREAGRQLRQQGQALFAQPTVDARAVEALRQQMLAQHDQASQRMMQVMLEVSRVLTPEQRKTLAERMSQRRSMMERQRADRPSTERTPR
ncbi:MAG: Spy/CpxP family protein refolding chaperone [Rubrivivax sp.]|nr:Spy/CpxP family protein refolding chaperone [Rubrivivax sp.]MDP3614553.1 Spy/CpxP family protein refolding chaperone [Rubrivivax sp.]